MTFWFFCYRDIRRRLSEAVLTFFAMATLVAVLGTVLLLESSAARMARGALELGPDLAAMKIPAERWPSIPEKAALDAALTVPGVVEAWSRIWGVVAGPNGPVTVIGAGGNKENSQVRGPLRFSPRPGEAIVGPGVFIDGPKSDFRGEKLPLMGVEPLALTVVGNFEDSGGLPVWRTVVVHESDARKLLGLSPDQASDMAVYVFHELEARAMVPELLAALPFPSAIGTREGARGAFARISSRRSGLFFTAMLPAVLALGLLTVAESRAGFQRRHEAGLLKALGWQGADIVKLRMAGALCIGVLALVSGMAAACLVVFTPAAAWPKYLLFGWEAQRPLLLPDLGGVGMVSFQATIGVLVPYLAACLWPAVKNSAADPMESMRP